MGGAFLTVLALSGLACLIVIWGYNHKVKKENNTNDLHTNGINTYLELIKANSKKLSIILCFYKKVKVIA